MVAPRFSSATSSESQDWSSSSRDQRTQLCDFGETSLWRKLRERSAQIGFECLRSFAEPLLRRGRKREGKTHDLVGLDLPDDEFAQALKTRERGLKQERMMRTEVVPARGDEVRRLVAAVLHADVTQLAPPRVLGG